MSHTIYARAGQFPLVRLRGPAVIGLKTILVERYFESGVLRRTVFRAPFANAVYVVHPLRHYVRIEAPSRKQPVCFRIPTDDSGSAVEVHRTLRCGMHVLPLGVPPADFLTTSTTSVPGGPTIATVVATIPVVVRLSDVTFYDGEALSARHLYVVPPTHSLWKQLSDEDYRMLREHVHRDYYALLIGA